MIGKSGEPDHTAQSNRDVDIFGKFCWCRVNILIARVYMAAYGKIGRLFAVRFFPINDLIQ